MVHPYAHYSLNSKGNNGFVIACEPIIQTTYESPLMLELQNLDFEKLMFVK